jgi:NAD(P)-dependent dehydrogenase (short-subunit alcohol dehydrogenase family)
VSLRLPGCFADRRIVSARPCRVINISAPSARLPIPYTGPIGASKAALESLSAAARIELAPWGIPVILVVPGGIDTPIFAKADKAAQAALADADPERVALYTRQLDAVAAAMGRQRTSSPQTVADTIARAVGAARPKAQYVANTDARLFLLVSHLPSWLRDRLLVRTLGLRSAAAATT